eukprot:5375924-Ditylum_brightwellii.AAC.1
MLLMPCVSSPFCVVFVVAVGGQEVLYCWSCSRSCWMRSSCVAYDDVLVLSGCGTCGTCTTGYSCPNWCDAHFCLRWCHV